MTEALEAMSNEKLLNDADAFCEGAQQLTWNRNYIAAMEIANQGLSRLNDVNQQFRLSKWHSIKGQLHKQIGDVFNHRAEYDRVLTSLQSAVSAYSEAVELEASAERYHQLGASYSRLAEFEQLIGDYGRSISNAKRALSQYESSLNITANAWAVHRDHALAHLIIADDLRIIGRRADAVTSLDAASQDIGQAEETLGEANSPRNKANLLMNRGRIALALGLVHWKFSEGENAFLELTQSLAHQVKALEVGGQNAVIQRRKGTSAKALACVEAFRGRQAEAALNLEIARNAYESSLKMSPEESDTLDEYGSLEFLTGDLSLLGDSGSSTASNYSSGLARFELSMRYSPGHLPTVRHLKIGLDRVESLNHAVLRLKSDLRSSLFLSCPWVD